MTMSSFILSLLSPVLRKMVCGNFRESVCKEIGLDDVEAARLLKLLQLGCGKTGLVAVDIQELLDLGVLAERLQMEAVRSELEDKLLKELRVENCLEMIQRSEASGLELLQKECYEMLRDEFGVISQKEAFLDLSEEVMGSLLEEEQLGVCREEDLFEAVVRWLTNSDEVMCAEGLLRKIRYGVMSNDYLAAYTETTLMSGQGMVKELLGEAMAKKGGAGGESMWDGVERLGDKWMVARVMKGMIIGADVLKKPAYVAIDGQGQIVVTDAGLHEVIIFHYDGSVAGRFGSKGAAAGQFNMPMGVAVDRRGHIIVADCRNHRIQVLNADGTMVHCFGCEGAAVGQLDGPWGVAIDRIGHIVVAEDGNHRIQVFNGDGSVVRHFGSYGFAIGQLNGPAGLAVDGAGHIVVADFNNHRVQVFDGNDGSVVLCFGSEGDEPGELNYPDGVAVDSKGRLVVAERINHRIQVFNPDGSVARVMGSEGDGVGEIDGPCGVAVGGSSRILVADCGNHRVQVW